MIQMSTEKVLLNNMPLLAKKNLQLDSLSESNLVNLLTKKIQ